MKNHLDVLRAVFRWARRDGYVVPESLDRLNAPPRERRTHVRRTRKSIASLPASPADVRDVLEMLVSVAVRPGDLFALTWDAVDDGSGVLRLADSKTGPRLVCLTERAETVLDRRRKLPRHSDGYVFTTVRGRRWSFRYFGEKIRDIRKAAGLGAHVIAYAMRHYMTASAGLMSPRSAPCRVTGRRPASFPCA